MRILSKPTAMVPEPAPVLLDVENVLTDTEPGSGDLSMRNVYYVMDRMRRTARIVQQSKQRGTASISLRWHLEGIRRRYNPRRQWHYRPYHIAMTPQKHNAKLVCSSHPDILKILDMAKVDLHERRQIRSLLEQLLARVPKTSKKPFTEKTRSRTAHEWRTE